MHERGESRLTRYWTLSRAPEPRDEQTVLEQLRLVLDETVKQHLESDVPLGTAELSATANDLPPAP